MFFRAFADIVVVVHLAFIVFVVLGGLLALRWRLAPLLHLPAVLWSVYIELSGGICPLTPLENSLRQRAGAAGYSGGFVEHYILPVVYPAGLTDQLQFVLAGTVIVANVLAYAFVLWRYHGRNSRAMKSAAPSCCIFGGGPRVPAGAGQEDE